MSLEFSAVCKSYKVDGTCSNPKPNYDRNYIINKNNSYVRVKCSERDIYGSCVIIEHDDGTKYESNNETKACPRGYYNDMTGACIKGYDPPTKGDNLPIVPATVVSDGPSGASASIYSAKKKNQNTKTNTNTNKKFSKYGCSDCQE